MPDDAREQDGESSSEAAPPSTGVVAGVVAAGRRGQVGGATSEEVEAEPRQPVILVVEDEAALRDIICRVLEMSGYAYEEAADGEEGLAMVQERAHPYDLIYSNLSMPRMNGDTFLNAIRPLVVSRVPRILGSGHAADIVLPLGLQAGACDILLYPFTIETLIAKVAWGLSVKDAYADLPRPYGLHDELAFLYRWSLTSGASSDLYQTSVLLRLLAEGDVAMARAAAAALGGLSALPPPLPAWVPALLSSEAPLARVQAARAVGCHPIGLRAALRVLEPALGHPDRDVAELAVSATREVLSVRH